MIERSLHLPESQSKVLLYLLALLVVCQVCILGSANVQAANRSVQQALIITIPLTNGGKDEIRRLHKLEDDLINAINRARIGEYDGNEEGDATFTMYAYGPSADKLFDVVQPVLAKYRLPPGSEAVKRYGKPGAKEERIPLLYKGTAN
jgi:hypothetical protein